ncbi:MAG: TniB family NTP-binding protein [Tildeniella nuda ZEHNDER 1965/U140]|nr:TniB family NTP-binding protein [Tildeniella nuda ZEHNDER 1965/U140]
MSLLRSPVGMYAGLAMVGGAYGINRKHQLTNGDYAAVLREPVNGFTEGWQHLFETFAFSRKDIGEARKLIQVQNLQKELKTNVQAWVEAESIKGEWLGDCIRRSLLVCGVSGDGKTTFLLWVLAKHFEIVADLHVTICDLDYGSSHEGSEPNWWFNLPRGRYIRASYEEIRDSILAESAEVDRRAKLSQDPMQVRNFQSRLLVIDELIAVIDIARSKGKDEFDPFISAFKNILNRGLKQRVKVICGVQNLTVTDTGLSLAAQDSFNTIVLHTSALKKDPLKRMGVEDVDAMLERAKGITRIPGCDRIGVVRTNQEINIRIMPYLSVDSVELKLPEDDTDPLEVWHQQVFTTAKLAEIEQLAEQFLAKEIKSPLRQIAIDCGLKELRNADPKYQRVKQVWESALQKVGVLVHG